MASTTSHADIVQRGWEAVGRGDWDTLIADYLPDMLFVMPGQTDMLHGRAAFRGALENLGAALPPGFEITGLRQISDGDEVVSILNWASTKCPGGSQLAVLFRFEGDKISEERWFVDTEQWTACF
jgi:ketosteroid isomerase-like protein